MTEQTTPATIRDPGNQHPGEPWDSDAASSPECIERDRSPVGRVPADPSGPESHGAPPEHLSPEPDPHERGTAHIRPPDDVPTRASACYVPAGTEAELIIRRGPGAGTHYRLPTEKPTTLGRARDCDVVLDDVTVSRHHATIRHDHERFVLTDGGSLNGTFLNRSPTLTAILADGDDIAIGIYRLTVTIHQGGGSGRAGAPGAAGQDETERS